MSSQSLARTKKFAKHTKKRKKTSPWRRASAGATFAWWPLLTGIAITVVAVQIAEILPLMGAPGLLKLQLLYPFALLLKQPQVGLAEQTGDSWSQIMLYAQWVLYGLYASVAIQWTSRRRALLQVAAVHVAAFGLLWWLSAR